MASTIDLNSDVGEGFGVWVMGDDEAMLDVVTSANIACGFHGGDPRIMRRTCEQAAARGVRIGAHVGYRDLAGFGRRAMDSAPGQVCDEALYQVAALDGFARAVGDRVRYVKPHGALYHAVSASVELAEELIAAITGFDRDLAVLGQVDTELYHAARRAGIGFVAEGFADRGYGPDGRLVPRGRVGAINDADDAVEQALTIARDGQVDTSAGPVSVTVASLCVHSDTPAAVAMAERIRTAVTGVGIDIAPFA